VKTVSDNKPIPNLIGSYGPWAAESDANWERRLSFLNPVWEDLDQWREAARNKVSELLAGPRIEPEIATGVRVRRRYSFDDLDIEELIWQLPYGPETEAVFLKPTGSEAPLPGILALHDHAAVKYFGKQKILRTSPKTHPFIEQHQDLYYGGVAWANTLARRGYGVLVHDVFPFESRRIKASELPGHVVKRMMSAPNEVEELTPEDLEKDYTISEYEVDEQERSDRIEAYNAFAAQHEDIIAKSLISAGFTWPGVFAAEDRAALDILCSRSDIDSQRVGCCGLSGGGLRTDYLAGLDDRIRCSATVGFMTTWRDLILNSCYTHTWMLYIPLLSRYMDFPDVLGMRAPLPSLVLATEEDPLFDREEVKRALNILEKVYAKAGSPENFSWAIHPGPHQFDRAMQTQAFEWFDHHLK
jgi:dienelactone hydrolase